MGCCWNPFDEPFFWANFLYKNECVTSRNFARVGNVLLDVKYLLKTRPFYILGGLVLHVSASAERLLQLAETTSLKKRDRETDVIRPFQAKQADLFDGGDRGVVGPLTISGVFIES